MTNSYLPKVGPVVGGGLPGFPTRTTGVPARGEMTFAIPGSYNWTVPEGVTSVCVVCVGGGSQGHSWNTTDDCWGGAGGGLGWRNNIKVIPGEIIPVTVGHGGRYADSSSTIRTAMSGGDSTFKDASTCKGAFGELTSTLSIGGSYVGDGGGDGGSGVVNLNDSSQSCSGSGAGGYSGNGGDGVWLGTATGLDGNAGSGGGGGSGGIGDNHSPAGGGGVGLFGEGTSGAAGIGSLTTPDATGGGGGSGGEPGESSLSNNFAIIGGNYGGGGSAIEGQSAGGAGGSGAVRILWGAGRAFPSTDVGHS